MKKFFLLMMALVSFALNGMAADVNVKIVVFGVPDMTAVSDYFTVYKGTVEPEAVTVKTGTTKVKVPADDNIISIVPVTGKTVYISVNSATAEAVTETYTLSVSEGDEIKVVPALNFTTSPETGSVVDSIKEIIFSFPEFPKSGADWAKQTITGAVKNIKGEAVSDATLDWGDENTQIKWTAVNAITTPGTYTITIPAGALRFGDVNIQPLTIMLAVGSETAQLVGVSPEAGSKVNLDTEYVLKFSKPVKYSSYISDITIGQNPFGSGDGATFSMNDDKTEIHVKLDKNNLAQYKVTNVEEAIETLGNMVYLHIYGVKDLATGEALEYNDTDDETQFTYSYTLGDPILSIEPSYGVGNKSFDALNFACRAGITLEDGTKSISLKKDGQELVSILASTLTSAVFDMSTIRYYTYSFSTPYTEAGEYSVTVPAGTFSLNGKLNKATVETFTIAGDATSINGVEASANAPVYNIAGQRVNNAQKGIFIQNGKKFVK